MVLDNGNIETWHTNLPKEVETWLHTHIFNTNGDLVHVKHGLLETIYPHKQLKRIYQTIPKIYIPLLHSPHIRSLWGRVIENDTDVSYNEYVHIENRITRYYRHKPYLAKYIDKTTYESDKWFFLNLIEHLCSKKREDMIFLLHYSAFLVQKKEYREKTGRILILCSLTQGVGKSVFTSILQKILNGSNITMHMLSNKFDAYRLGRKNLTILEESENLLPEHYATIKALATATVLETSVKHSMEDIKIHSSFECIITANKRPSPLRNLSNRREVLIECTIGKPKDPFFFEPISQQRDSLYANIASYLSTISVDRELVHTYIQKERSGTEVSTCDIHLFIKDLLSYGVLPSAKITGETHDWLLMKWPEENQEETGLTPQLFYNCFLQYSLIMKTNHHYSYRFFLDEVKKIVSPYLSFGSTVSAYGLSKARSQYEETFVRISITPWETEHKAFLSWIKSL